MSNSSEYTHPTAKHLSPSKTPRLRASRHLFVLLATASFLVACAEGEGSLGGDDASTDVLETDFNQVGDTTDAAPDTNEPDTTVTCPPNECQVGVTTCDGVYATIACVADQNGCGVLGEATPCRLTEVCEDGACVEFATCKDNDNDSFGEGCDAGPDCNDNNPKINPMADEVCGDNVDNNCNDATDEDCEVACSADACTVGDRRCNSNTVEECVADSDGCGSWSMGATCDNGCEAAACVGCVDNDNDGRGAGCALGEDCNDANPDMYEGNTEICDGLDNDCSGDSDEPFVGKGDNCTAGQGICERTGKMVCNAQKDDIECDATAGTKEVELCGDSLDNDCDGETDEGYPVGTSCSIGADNCTSNGSQICDPNDRTKTICDAPAPTGSTEVCDNVDNNCDGQIDEGGVCAGCIEDQYEENDSSTKATDLKTAKKLDDVVSCETDRDWFTLGVVTSPVTVEFTHPTGSGPSGDYASLQAEVFCGTTYCQVIRTTNGSVTHVFDGTCGGNACVGPSELAFYVSARMLGNPPMGNPTTGTPYTIERK